MDSKLEPAVAAYLDNLNVELSGLPLEKQKDVRDEILQHLEALAAAEVLLGGSSIEAINVALRQFGNPRQIGRQIAREWRLREWQRRGVILLKTLVAPVSYVGMAALGTLVLAVTGFEGAPWLQRAYWLIGLEVVIKLDQAAFAIASGANPVAVSYGSASSGGLLTDLRGVPLHLSGFLSRLKTPRLPVGYLVVAALSAMLLAVLSWVSGWPDDYTARLFCASWVIALYLCSKWLLDRPGPFAAQQKARLESFIRLLQALARSTCRVLGAKASSTHGISGTPVRPDFILPSGVPSDRRSVPLNTACFLFPPLGLASWLILDGSSPRKARSAGRGAVRGAVVALILLWVLNTWFSVHIAIFSIDNAHLQPINPNLPYHSLRRHAR